jgi:hypothetical protein
MLPARLTLLLGACSLLFLSACGSSSNGTSRGTIGSTGGNGGAGGNPPSNPIGGGGGLTGSNNSVVATASVAGIVSVVAGARRTISITFTSSDGKTISGFGVSGNLAMLPAGWSGPGSFACASVSSGSGCVLNLTYAPSAADSGTLTLHYVFIDNASMPSTGGSIAIPYAATTNNNVVAAVSPTGEINSGVGAGNQSVSVNFTTDDGNAATNLALTTDLAALPAGWSSTAGNFSCAIVSTGNGCQLPLTYAPTAAARGTLTLNYSFTDDSGAARTAALNIPYSSSSHGNVVATASPSGEINAVEPTGAQAVAVTFTTDDGKPATALYLTSDLAALPTGWTSSAQSFACAGVGTGNGCQLHLTYAPAALTRGTLTLTYAYTDAAGTAQAGSLNIAYAATTNDNAVATASPTGQINALVNSGSQAVTVTFTTDDGRPATALQITGGLSALPAGWSSTAAGFSCGGFSSGNACQLPLTYAPMAPGSGTLALSYTYRNNAGESKLGSLNIAYRATANDNVVGTPSVNPLAVVTGTRTGVDITFTTDDGNLASGLLLTSDLSALPPGWSSPSLSFACSSISTGTACRLSLTYAPTADAGGTLSLSFSYDDNSGNAKLGSVSIPYTARSPHLYVAEYPGPLYYCSLNGGIVSNCIPTPTGNVLTAPTGIAFSGNFAYVTDYDNNIVNLCNVGLDGSLSGCAPTGGNFQSPWQLAVSGSMLYATNATGTGGVTSCLIAVDGTLSGCTQSSGTGTAGIAVGQSYAYVGVGPTAVDMCAVSGSGSLTGCVGTGSGFSALNGITLAGSYVYVANQGNGTVSVCSVNTDGTLSSCAASPVGVEPSDVVIQGSQAYVNDASGNVYVCAVGAAGALGSCIMSNGGATFNFGIQIAIH